MLNGLKYLIQPRRRKQENVRNYAYKEMIIQRVKDEPPYLLFLAIQWNGVKRLQQDTQIQISIGINIVTHKFIERK
jgi:hypothetical protein